MSTSKQNRLIAQLIVGALSVDGVPAKEEAMHVAHTLQHIGLEGLIPSVAFVLAEDDAQFNMFACCNELQKSLAQAKNKVQLAEIVFRVISDVVASDHFVSSREAAYLSAIAKRLEIPIENAQRILKEVMAARSGRLEIAGGDVDALLHPHMKELLSFPGAEQLVGEFGEAAFSTYAKNTCLALAEGISVSKDDLGRAYAMLGVPLHSALSKIESTWRNSISEINVAQMADLGETFVSAAINRLKEINDAYKILLQHHSKKPTL